MLVVSCPHCGKKYKVSDSAVGKSGHCSNKSCLKTFRVEVVPTADEVHFSEASPETDSEADAATASGCSTVDPPVVDSQHTPFQFEIPSPPMQQQLVTLNENGSVDCNVSSVAEAKLAVKQLRLLKKQISSHKREILSQQRIIRANYTASVRNRWPTVRGAGKVGSFLRGVQAASQQAARWNLAKELEPLVRVARTCRVETWVRRCGFWLARRHT